MYKNAIWVVQGNRQQPNEWRVLKRLVNHKLTEIISNQSILIESVARCKDVGERVHDEVISPLPFHKWGNGGGGAFL